MPKGKPSECRRLAWHPARVGKGRSGLNAEDWMLTAYFRFRRAMCFKRLRERGGDHLRAAGFDIASLHHVHQLAVAQNPDGG
jgi:hypothetical protein